MSSGSTASSTCPRCLDGRHLRCANKAACPCSICGTRTTSEQHKRAALQLAPRRRIRSTTDRRTRMPGVGRGNNPCAHRPVGYSTLDPSTQADIERMLSDGVAIIEIARRLGCSRDQVRTIRNRGMGMTHRDVKALRKLQLPVPSVNVDRPPSGR